MEFIPEILKSNSEIIWKYICIHRNIAKYMLKYTELQCDLELFSQIQSQYHTVTTISSMHAINYIRIHICIVKITMQLQRNIKLLNTIVKSYTGEFTIDYSYVYICKCALLHVQNVAVTLSIQVACILSQTE